MTLSETWPQVSDRRVLSCPRVLLLTTCHPPCRWALRQSPSRRGVHASGAGDEPVVVEQRGHSNRAVLGQQCGDAAVIPEEGESVAGRAAGEDLALVVQAHRGKQAEIGERAGVPEESVCLRGTRGQVGPRDLAAV